MQHFNHEPTNQSQPPLPRLDAEWLAGRIQIMFSAYRKDDYQDPEGFLVQLGLNLERFPQEIVEYVTSPTTGIQTRSDWPPTLAEIVKACKAEQMHRENIARYASLPSPQVRLPRPKYSAEDSYDAMVKAHGRPFGVFEAGRQLPYGK